VVWACAIYYERERLVNRYSADRAVGAKIISKKLKPAGPRASIIFEQRADLALARSARYYRREIRRVQLA
jgi:hypothetical protein